MCKVGTCAFSTQNDTYQTLLLVEKFVIVIQNTSKKKPLREFANFAELFRIVFSVIHSLEVHVRTGTVVNT